MNKQADTDNPREDKEQEFVFPFHDYSEIFHLSTGRCISVKAPRVNE